jgi:peptide/nickel transport system substrate-binding protein
MNCRWSVSASLFFAFLLAFGSGACGGGGARNEISSGGEGEAPRPATENQINRQPRDRVQDGGRLTWPIESMPVTYNYSHLDGTEYDHTHTKHTLLPRIFLADAGANPFWNPDYLSSEPTLVTEPKQVVTYNINPKAIWYDGTPISWEDFHWHWRALNGSNKEYQIASSTGYSDIESVARGRDDREVVVTFKNKVAAWQALFYALLPASTTKSPKIFNDGWRERPLTTAGPFKLGNIDRTAKTVTLVRNEKWWGKPAKLDTIVFRAIDPDAQIDAIANGEIDLMDIGPDVNKFTRARGISGTEIRYAGGPNFRHITINGTGAILRDVKVRQALAMAIDRAAIARAMLGPLGIEPTALGNHIFMRNQTGYQDNSGDVGRHNPGRAAQLLDEAGWRLDGNLRKKDGRTLEINCVIPAAVTTSRQESELVQNMLGQLGVRVTINTVPSQDFFEKYIRPGQFDFTMFSWLGTPYPISSARGLYAKPTMGPKGELAIQQNYARIGSDEIDRLFAEATQELDRKRAIELANRIDALIWQEVHSLTLYQRPEMWVTKTGLANHGAFGFAELVYEDMGWLKQ